MKGLTIKLFLGLYLLLVGITTQASEGLKYVVYYIPFDTKLDRSLYANEVVKRSWGIKNIVGVPFDVLFSKINSSTCKEPVSGDADYRVKIINSFNKDLFLDSKREIIHSGKRCKIDYKTKSNVIKVLDIEFRDIKRKASPKIKSIDELRKQEPNFEDMDPADWLWGTP